jgi:hypothetical protein
MSLKGWTCFLTYDHFHTRSFHTLQHKWYFICLGIPSLSSIQMKILVIFCPTLPPHTCWQSRKYTLVIVTVNTPPTPTLPPHTCWQSRKCTLVIVTLNTPPTPTLPPHTGWQSRKYTLVIVTLNTPPTPLYPSHRLTITEIYPSYSNFEHPLLVCTGDIVFVHGV